MANGKQSTVKRMKMAERAQIQLDLHFPGWPPEILWTRKTNDGFITIPRTMPIVMQAIDMQSKGTPAGHTLFCLWARSPDNPLVTIESATTFAAEAGFVGERAVDTWRKRMKRLRELSMISTKPGPSGDFHYVLLLNPNTGVEWMRSHGLVQDGLYARFVERMADIGAYGELEAVQALWKRMWEAQQGAAAASSEPASPPTRESEVPLTVPEAPE